MWHSWKPIYRIKITTFHQTFLFNVRVKFDLIRWINKRFVASFWNLSFFFFFWIQCIKLQIIFQTFNSVSFCAVMNSLSYSANGKHFVCMCTSVHAEVLDPEAESWRICVRLHLQLHNWPQFTDPVTVGTFRVFGAAGPNWQKREINKVRHWAWYANRWTNRWTLSFLPKYIVTLHWCIRSKKAASLEQKEFWRRGFSRAWETLAWFGSGVYPIILSYSLRLFKSGNSPLKQEISVIWLQWFCVQICRPVRPVRMCSTWWWLLSLRGRTGFWTCRLGLLSQGNSLRWMGRRARVKRTSVVGFYPSAVLSSWTDQQIY